MIDISIVKRIRNQLITRGAPPCKHPIILDGLFQPSKVVDFYGFLPSTVYWRAIPWFIKAQYFKDGFQDVSTIALVVDFHNHQCRDGNHRGITTVLWPWHCHHGSWSNFYLDFSTYAAMCSPITILEKPSWQPLLDWGNVRSTMMYEPPQTQKKQF